ncbi:type II secretion system secretin GspD [Kordiimonas sp. SCSIO 12610]|nr:type II secretion system secretin GspD [Kordiimonas sp. SCSIO 12610]
MLKYSLSVIALTGIFSTIPSLGNVNFVESAIAQDQVLNFRDADIRAMIDDISMMTGKTFILDPRVQGKITIISREPVPTADVFDMFLSALRVYGFTAVPTKGGAYKIVPDEAGVTDRTATGIDVPDDQLITEVFRINYVDAITALNTVKPIIHRLGRAIAHRSNNFLVVVDYAGNMERIRSVLKSIDRDTATTRLISLVNTSTEEMAETISALRSSGAGDENRNTSLKVIPVLSSNTLILKGDQEVVDELMPIITDLDSRSATKGDIEVIYLKHADAEEIVPTLEQISRSIASSSSGTVNAGNTLAPQGVVPVSQPIVGNSGGGARATIAYDRGTNALIISASPDMQKALADVIRKLDVPRAQVIIEAIIVEISDQAAKDLGVQYVLSGGEGSNIPFTATNFAATAPNILATTGALLVDDDSPFAGQGDALRTAAVNSLLGTNGFLGGFAGESGGTIFGVILNALQQDISSNILSTPFLTTLNNQPASLIVGQEIPVTSGEVLGNDNSNPFRTVTRQEVGIQLDVTPQINEGDQIRLQINQEVSSVEEAIITTSADFITNKRQIQTTVMAEDGEIIVLGGLIQQDESITLNKVPLLGDIPVLGNLFKSESKSLEKTNLMVFIRPTILRDGADVRDVTRRKYQYTRQQQLEWREDGGEAGIDVILRDVIGGKTPPKIDN